VCGFATGIWNGYCDASLQLAAPAEGRVPSSHFQVREVSAVLNYSVPPSAGEPLDTTPFIRTQATIAIDDEDLAAPRMRAIWLGSSSATPPCLMTGNTATMLESLETAVCVRYLWLNRAVATQSNHL
jgi:hypothetical protein